MLHVVHVLSPLRRVAVLTSNSLMMFGCVTSFMIQISRIARFFAFGVGELLLLERLHRDFLCRQLVHADLTARKLTVPVRSNENALI